MLNRWKKAALHTLLIWQSILSWVSNKQSRFLTSLEGGRVDSSTRKLASAFTLDINSLFNPSNVYRSLRDGRYLIITMRKNLFVSLANSNMSKVLETSQISFT